MITDNGKYYLYRHIRHDTNMPFYIGIGKKEDNGQYRATMEYRRAHVKSRNKYWNSVVKTTSYDVEILLESDDKLFIEHKEKEFISIYGRKDTMSGILCNMTDGADYYPVSNTNTRNNMTTERRREIFKNAYKPPLGTNPVNVYVYNKVSGGYINHFPQIKLAALDLKIDKASIGAAIKNRNSVKEYIFSEIYLGVKCSVSNFKIRKDREQPILRIDPITLNVLDRFEKSRDAVIKFGISASNIPTVINKGTKAKGFYWKYDDGKEFIPQNKRNRYQKIEKIDANTLKIICVYDTIKEATAYNGYKSASSIRSFLNSGKSYNGIIWKRVKHL